MIRLHKNNTVKKVSTGFSWKSLMFGVFYPMSRGDYKGMLIQFAICFITHGAAWLIIPFTYNRVYIKRLLRKGYKPKDSKSLYTLVTKYNYNQYK